MSDTPHSASPATGSSGVVPRCSRGSCPTQHAAARSDADSASDPACASRPSRRRRGAAVHRTLAASANQCERAELGIHCREGPPGEGEARQALPPGLESLLRHDYPAPLLATNQLRRPRAVQWQVDHFTEIPVLIVACLRLGAREGRLPYVRMPHAAESGYYGSIYPSVQNLLLAARAMGLGASLITLPLWGVMSARRILNLPRSVTPRCIVPLGWPCGRYGPTTRKPVEQVTHLDAYGNLDAYGTRNWLDISDPGSGT